MVLCECREQGNRTIFNKLDCDQNVMGRVQLDIFTLYIHFVKNDFTCVIPARNSERCIKVWTAKVIWLEILPSHTHCRQYFFQVDFFLIFKYLIQHCFIVSVDAKIEARTV
jgi:hypothetical protein